MTYNLITGANKSRRKMPVLFFCLLLVLYGCKKEEEPYLKLSVSEIIFTKQAEKQTIDIHTNVSWETSISPASAASWVGLSAGRGGTQDAAFTVSVAENKEYDDRTAEIVFKSVAGTQILRVTQQEVKALLLDESDKEQPIWQPGGKLPVKIQRNVDYTLAVSENAQSWIHLPVTKALVTDELIFTIDENTTGDDRLGEIYIFGKDSITGAVKPEWSDTIHVLQQKLSLTADREKLDFGRLAQKKWVIVYSTHQRKLSETTTVSDYTYSVPPEAASWCTVEKSEVNEEYLSVSVTENTTGADRFTAITLSSSDSTKTIQVEQKATSSGIYYDDGAIVPLQTPTQGNGVNLIIMGDGFTKNDLDKGGFYEKTMRDAAEHFFSIEPYASYRDYFKVDMIAVESEEEGVNDITGTSPAINNKFNSTFGKGTEITCNPDLCSRYVAAIPGIRSASSRDGNFYIDTPCVVILVVNSTRYAGTTTMYDNGFSIAMIPMSAEAAPNDFEGLVHHEAGGHGFGLFGDEYVYYEAGIPASKKQDIMRWQKTYGFYPNVDFTNNFTQIKWKEFTGHNKYPYVGAYEGAFMYAQNIWRPEENTCMNDNIPYFSAPCRRFIINRIMRLAGLPEPSFSEFAAQDNVVPPVTVKSGVPYRKMPPLGRPKMVEIN